MRRRRRIEKEKEDEEENEEDAKKELQKEYSSRDLGGLKVEHTTDAFTEGKSVILTLKDAGVLDQDAGDTLVNVNLAQDERTKKRVDDLKKFKAGYNAFDNEEVDELTGDSWADRPDPTLSPKRLLPASLRGLPLVLVRWWRP